MRVVLDTNQLVRMAAAGEQSPLFEAWQNRLFFLLASPELLAEFEAVMVRPELQRWLRFSRASRLLTLLHERAILVSPVTNAPSCRDPKDDMIIATALGGRADFVVTSDRDLLDDDALRQSLATYRLRIISPLEFLEHLEQLK